MPLGKYYCDYCDKQFQDTPFARKRHLQGLSHLRAKALWFDSLLLHEPNQAYAEGYVRGVCNRFVNTGFCQYGDTCKYFHPKNVATPAPRTPRGDNVRSMVIPGSHLVEGTSSQGNVVVTDSTGMATAWGILPPSLKPPPEGGYPPLPFLDWG
ncbi:zinc finger CCCH domain-containing protein 3 [Syzygium oleosum]|uniref:zinc finger CCCH domain-containing protein 3 n=1 Tax=Syzygium oleosum TaxID=219896 RepID=UPI0011D1D57F|nr:zinc finger CCCH domain-containing protein 3 [Syzygium oleosum]